MEDPGSSIISFLILAVLLALSALFSGSETAFFGLSPYRLRELKDGGHKRAQQVSTLLGKPNSLLTTLLVGNTAVNIAFLYAAIQIVKSMLLTPIIIGRQVNQKPATVLIALLIGGQFYGIAGLLLAVPVLSMLKILISFFAGVSLKIRQNAYKHR